MAQPTLSKVFTPSIIGPGSVSTATFTITNGSASPVTGLSFTDVLPTVPGDVDIADPANVSTNCDLGPTGTLTAPDGGGTITLSDAQMGGSQSCTVNVDVTASTPGAHTNPAVTLSSSAGSSMSLPVDLTVATDRPSVSKSFAPSSVPLGGRSTMTITIDNSLNASALSSLVVNDPFPLGLEVASPSNASTTCGGPNPMLTVVPGANQIRFQSFGILFPGFEVMLAGETCTITTDVIATASGMLHNTTNDITSNAGSSGKASDTLTVTVTTLAISKSFTDDPVPQGNAVTLEFAISNFDRNFSAESLAFTDDLTTLMPALPGLTFQSVLFNDCGGAVAGAGGTTISLSGGTLAPEGSCTVRVSLDVPASASTGDYTNTSSAITATVDGSPVVGNMATDDLFVSNFPVLTKTFLPNPVEPGDTVTVEFTVTNSSATSSATDIAFSDPFPDILPTASATPGNDCCGAGSTCTFSPLIDSTDGTIPAMLAISGASLAPAGMAGDSCTFSITMNVNPLTAAGLYPNITTEITATVDGTQQVGPPAADSLSVVSAPLLSKSFPDAPVAPGDTVTMEFTLSHSADAATAATGITFTDDLNAMLAGVTANLPPLPDPPCGAGSSVTGSAGDTFLTLMDGELQPGEECTFSVSLDVPAAAAPGTYTNTTSGVSATVDGLAVSSTSASEDLLITAIDFTKEFIGNPALPGETVQIRFTLENISPTEDATSISFSDDFAAVLPGAPDLIPITPATTDTCNGTPSFLGPTFLFFSGGSLTAGTSCILEFDVIVPAGASDGSFVNTTNNLTAVVDGSVFVGPQATAPLVIDSSLLNVVKTFTDDPVAPGDAVTLEFILSNEDTASAASAIAFSDDLGAGLPGLTFDSVLFDDCGGTVSGTGTEIIDVSAVSLAADASCTIRVSASVPGATAAGVYNNVTSGMTGMIDGFPVTGTAGSDDLEIIQLLNFSKSFDGPTTATGSAILTFTITNPGTDTASSLDFSDDLDAVTTGLIATSLPALPCGPGSSITGISFLTFTGGELPPMGGTCSFDVEVLVPVTATAGTFPNTTSDLTQNGLEVAEPATANLTIEPPPIFAKAFSPDSIGTGQTVTLTFTVDNSASSLAASALDFTDNLPAGVVVATPANASTTCTGGTLTAVAGTGVISYSGGNVGASASCTVQADVTGNAAGTQVNTTGNLTSSSGNSGTATDTLVVNTPPAFSKSFAPNPIVEGGVSTLTFTIGNTGSTVASSGLDFTDNLPAGLLVATPANASTTCTGGTLTAADAAAVVTYTGGTIASASSCTVQVDVTAANSGNYANTSGSLTSSLGNSGTASDTLRVNPTPAFSKAFTPDSILSGGVSTLTFAIDNTGSTVAATALDFTDNLPAGVSVATPANAINTCTGGTVTAASGTGVISYTGGAVAASNSCTLSVDVTSSTIGSVTNTSGNLTSSLGNSGTASDDLLVVLPPAFSKAFSPTAIGSGQTTTLTLTIDNTGSTLAATALDFTDNLPAGVLIALPASVVNTCTGGTVTAAAGTGVISYTGGSVAASSSCTLSVDVTSSTLGDAVNVTGDLTSSAGNSGTATDTLSVNPQPSFSKVFSPDSTFAGAPSVLTFSIDNSGAADSATGLNFTDNLPAGVVVASPANASTTCTGGTLTAVSGLAVISYSGGSVSASSTCSISVDVTATSSGTFVNTTADLLSNFGNSGTASDTLSATYLGFAKVFADVSAPAGAVIGLSFEITNPSSDTAYTDIAFSDDLDAFAQGVTAVGLPQSDVCGAGSTLSGSNVINLSGGSLPPGGSCQFDVTLSIDQSTLPGDYINTTDALTAVANNTALNGGPASQAQAPLTVTEVLPVPTLNIIGLLALMTLLGGLAIRRGR